MFISDFLLSLLVSVLGSIPGTMILQLLEWQKQPSLWQPADA